MGKVHIKGLSTKYPTKEYARIRTDRKRHNIQRTDSHASYRSYINEHECQDAAAPRTDTWTCPQSQIEHWLSTSAAYDKQVSTEEKKRPRSPNIQPK